MQHPGHAYPAFKRWLRANRHEIQIAGAYRDAKEAKAVEAALISASDPEFNRVPGDGPSFLPLGVPLELADRARQRPLTLSEIGRRTRGALLVYLAPGDLLSDGRRKFDPARPDDRIAVINTDRWWQIGRLQEQWLEEPRTAPRVVLGVHGVVKHRFIVASLRIDASRLGQSRMRDPRRSSRWRIPLIDDRDLDTSGIRGRRVADATFSNMAHQLHIWVDRDGRARHGPW
jgi:hypothetical protein